MAKQAKPKIHPTGRREMQPGPQGKLWLMCEVRLEDGTLQWWPHDLDAFYQATGELAPGQHFFPADNH